MSKVSAEKFIELLRRSELIDIDPLKKALAAISAESGGELPTDVNELSERLVATDLLTSWQANNLLNGKHKGFWLGNYKLLGHIGTGGMSSVYLAQHIHMGHRVAIKVLPRAKVEDSSYLARFYLEAKAAAKVNHPNIVRAHDIDNDGKTHYIVMDFVDGIDLQELVKRDGPLDYAMAADYAMQAACGLACAHENSLIHRDIKPANLLVDEEKKVMILDMGLAKFSDDDEPSLTMAHDENVLGTADYLSPEQAINSHGVDLRTDIYSLGCTLYYLLTGHPPFNEGSLPERLMKHQTQKPPSIYQDREDAPRDLVDICEKMMVKSPEGRYQRAEDVAADLKNWLTHSGAVVGSASAAVGSGRKGSGGTDSGIHKELRTRKPSGPPGSPPIRPPSENDTAHGSNADTIKGSSRNRSDTTTTPSGMPLIHTQDSDERPSDFGKRKSKGESSNVLGRKPSVADGSSKKRSQSSREGHGSGAHRTRRSRSSDSGELIFGSEHPSDSFKKSGTLSGKSRKSVHPKGSSENLTWIWIALVSGLVAFGLLVKMLFDAS